ncbi:hypothetical protein T492DRAFT_843993 [Pavlovales sp. CCMP2436]|nr:hypothetical protein T492DRAFT_843993 [Pavlovales sp. CCMP2436]
MLAVRAQALTAIWLYCDLDGAALLLTRAREKGASGPALIAEWLSCLARDGPMAEAAQLARTTLGTADTGRADIRRVDTGRSREADTGRANTGVPDTVADTRAPDTGVPDTVADTRAPDTGVPDTIADTRAPDTGVADTGRTDTGRADTGAADTGRADTGRADTGSSDTRRADTRKTLKTGGAVAEARSLANTRLLALSRAVLRLDGISMEAREAEVLHLHPFFSNFFSTLRLDGISMAAREAEFRFILFYCSRPAAAGRNQHGGERGGESAWRRKKRSTLRLDGISMAAREAEVTAASDEIERARALELLAAAIVNCADLRAREAAVHLSAKDWRAAATACSAGLSAGKRRLGGVAARKTLLLRRALCAAQLADHAAAAGTF